MNGFRLYGRYVSASIRAQAQYPAATLLLTAGHLAATAIEILGVYALFHRFGQVQGWSFGEVALFYGLINISFSIADLLSRGFDVFGSDFVRDRCVRPRVAETSIGRAAADRLRDPSVPLRPDAPGPGRGDPRDQSSPRSIGMQRRSRLPSGPWPAAWRCSPESWCCRRHSPSGPSRAWRSSTS